MKRLAFAAAAAGGAALALHHFAPNVRAKHDRFGTIVGTGLGLALLGWIINVVSRDTYLEVGMPVALAAGSLATAAALGIIAVPLAPLINARRLRT